ncbi:MAG TPA: exodeoxyribonuclease VII small subunit [Chthoniobacterales bacterium]|jgi:exodeoxyribonuclease VII small subunit|nr:exodeoxyribonuclease VII small subunit [Chthoniobacterales bacterium]
MSELSKDEPAVSPNTPVSLESALERLDAIVRDMEAGDLPLETLIAKYEEGIGLSKICREKLDRAEERIRIISRDAAGNPVLEEFNTSGTE